MNHWIQVQSNIATHKKTYALAEALHISHHEALGLMVNLWTWAAVNAVDGDITDYSPMSIKKALGTKRSAQQLRNGFFSAHLLDETADGRVVIHNWEKYANLLIAMEKARKDKVKSRVKRHRERMTSNVTETLCNAPTVPNRTVPYQTEPNQTTLLSLSEERNPPLPPQVFSPGGGDGDLSILEKFQEKRGAKLEMYFGYDQVAKDLERYMVSGLKLWSRKPNPGDEEIFFHQGTVWDGESRQIDEPRMDLLFYAMNQAVLAGKIGNWNYVQGILSNLAYRGITSLEEAESYDEAR